MGRVWSAFLVCFFLFFGQLFAQASVIFDDPVVQKTQVSGVEYKLTTQEYTVLFSDGIKTYGTRMFAEFKTKSVDELKKYGIVQFAKGCQFYSRKINGKIVYLDNFYRHLYYDTAYRNQIVAFIFKDWSIDSVYSNPNNLDPLFHIPVADLNWQSRHDAYLWNDDPSGYSEDKEHFYFDQKPTWPRLYVADEPGQGFFDHGQAKNVSLEFKTCLYNIKDVPVLTSLSQSVDIKKALACLNWKESYVYNFETQKVESLKSIHPHCN